MKFRAFVCDKCGYRLISASDHPKCECGKFMSLMKDREEINKFSDEVKNKFRSMLGE